MRHFVKRLTPKKANVDYVYEEVDGYTFNNLPKACNRDGEKLYDDSQTFCILDNGQITVNGTFTLQAFAVMNHIAGNGTGKACPPINGVAYYDCPEMVYMKNTKGNLTIHVMGDAGCYKKG